MNFEYYSKAEAYDIYTILGGSPKVNFDNLGQQEDFKK